MQQFLELFATNNKQQLQSLPLTCNFLMYLNIQPILNITKLYVHFILICFKIDCEPEDSLDYIESCSIK
jgi:hypothetical protein